MYNSYEKGVTPMATKKRVIDKELRTEIAKEKCYEIMDYLMVHFDDSKDIHYNYYFDTPDFSLAERDITLRERTIRKENDTSYHLTLRVPTIDKDTYVEYHQRLSEKEMRLLIYNNKLPEGEIKDLDSIHGGSVKNVNMIRVNRINAPYKDIKIYFDKISHRGKTHYEIGTKIDTSGDLPKDARTKQFKDLLESFGVAFKQAKRRSKKFQ